MEKDFFKITIPKYTSYSYVGLLNYKIDKVLNADRILLNTLINIGDEIEKKGREKQNRSQRNQITFINHKHTLQTGCEQIICPFSNLDFKKKKQRNANQTLASVNNN